MKGWSKSAPKGKERSKMLKKCGSKCFLDPKNKKYPVCSKGSCKVSKKGLQAAYTRARQYHRQGIANKAKRKMGKSRRKSRKKSRSLRSKKKSKRRRSLRKSKKRSRSSRRKSRRKSKKRSRKRSGWPGRCPIGYMYCPMNSKLKYFQGQCIRQGYSCNMGKKEYEDQVDKKFGVARSHNPRRRSCNDSTFNSSKDGFSYGGIVWQFKQ